MNWNMLWGVLIGAVGGALMGLAFLGLYRLTVARQRERHEKRHRQDNVCPYCMGARFEPGEVPCPWCQGTGRMTGGAT